MKRISARCVLPILFVALLAGCATTPQSTPSSSRSSSRFFVWERLDVDIRINEDGSFTVIESYVLNFVRGRFSYGFREIPLQHPGQIRDIAAYEDTPTSNYLVPLDVVHSEKDNKLEIKYYFRPAERERRIFLLRYTVINGLYREKNQLYLWWEVIFPNRSGYAVQNARVTIQTPEGSVVRKINVEGTAVKVQGEGSSTITLDLQSPIPDGVQVVVKAWIEGSRLMANTAVPQRILPSIPISLLSGLSLDFLALAQLIAAMIGLGGVLIAIGIYLKYGRNPKVAANPFAFNNTEPPNIPPWLAGAIYDGRPDLDDALAAIIDLARRGVLQIHEKMPRRWWLYRGERFDEMRAGQQLTPIENTVIRELHLDEISNFPWDPRSGGHFGIFQDMWHLILQELVEGGYFSDSVVKIFNNFRAVARLSVMVTIVGSLMLVNLFDRIDLAFYLGLGLAVMAAAFNIVAERMSLRTQLGAEMQARLTAFRKHLMTLGESPGQPLSGDLFERYLPWAIALGLSKQWLCKPVTQSIGIPRWYVPYSASHRQDNTDMASSWFGLGRAHGTFDRIAQDIGEMLVTMAISLSHLPLGVRKYRIGKRCPQRRSLLSV